MPTGERLYVVGNFIAPEEEIPVPDQLRKVASVALAAAHQSRQLRAGFMKRTREPRYAWVETQQKRALPPEFDTFEQHSGLYRTQILANTVVSIDPDTQQEIIGDTASRRIFRYRQITQERLFEDIWKGELREYSFEWNDHETVLSQCRISEIPSLDQDEILEAYIKYLAARGGDESDEELLLELPTTTETRFVTRQECADLLRVMRQRRLAVDMQMRDAA